MRKDQTQTATSKALKEKRVSDTLAEMADRLIKQRSAILRLQINIALNPLAQKTPESQTPKKPFFMRHKTYEDNKTKLEAHQSTMNAAIETYDSLYTQYRLIQLLTEHLNKLDKWDDIDPDKLFDPDTFAQFKNGVIRSCAEASQPNSPLFFKLNTSTKEIFIHLPYGMFCSKNTEADIKITLSTLSSEEKNWLLQLASPAENPVTPTQSVQR